MIPAKIMDVRTSDVAHTLRVLVALNRGVYGAALQGASFRLNIWLEYEADDESVQLEDTVALDDPTRVRMLDSLDARTVLAEITVLATAPPAHGATIEATIQATLAALPAASLALAEKVRTVVTD